MNSGIYLLTFKDGSHYVGQAQNMQTRWDQHADKLRKGQASKKMQEAYNKNGFPGAQILITCHNDYLNILEAYYIHQYKDMYNNLNTSIPKLDASVDYDKILDKSELFKFSTMHVMQHLVDTCEELLKYKEPFDKAKEEAANAKLVRVYKEAFERVNTALTKLKNRGLLARIFNTTPQ